MAIGKSGLPVPRQRSDFFDHFSFIEQMRLLFSPVNYALDAINASDNLMARWDGDRYGI